MPLQPSDIAELMLKHISAELSVEEQSLLDQWLAADPANHAFFARITAAPNLEQRLEDYLHAHAPETAASIFRKIQAGMQGAPLAEQATPRVEMPQAGMPQEQVFHKEIARMGIPHEKMRQAGVRRFNWRPYAAAAAVLLFGSLLFLWKNGGRGDGPGQAEVASIEDVKPGREGAILTLADGRQVTLDSIANGILARQQNTEVLVRDGQLHYQGRNGAAGNESAIAAWNTISTPRGRKYNLVLPDGSRVWLNAASSISFPVAFRDNERRVRITGEVYFEVVKAAPFIVECHNQTVEVLGTRFNINSYYDEAAIRTSLLEGSVRIRGEQEERILKPGQQSLIHPGKAGIEVREADLERVMAWRNGQFSFHDASLEEVLRQFARWYDLEVRYENDVPHMEFEGRMGMDVSLAKLLVFFDESGVKFRMAGKDTLIVSGK